MQRNQYLLPRLTRLWTHLERQKGGIGLRGPGETEIETDRRIIRDKITLLKKKLKIIDKQMAVQRKNRGKMVRVALVGYTNVGKSTLMNVVSKSNVFAENKLFATLDTTVRKVVIKNIPFLLTDTVGFIRKLPTQLVESFKSTLDEVREADLLLHVVDISHPSFEDHIASVNKILDEIKSVDKPTIMVFNKIDALPDAEPRIDRDANGNPFRVWLSARDGQGIDLLKQAIAELLAVDVFDETLTLSSNYGRLRAMLFEHGAVKAERYDEAGRFVLDVKLPKKDYLQILARAELSEEQIESVSVI